ncbi:MAG TPA: tRNA-dihydrouridine synthase family protein [Opitutaceae bacterium]|jgi:tRNA-dihydrouridine synthase B|nr:tRNA-dihydrouridine synthase family protein [Opitutaceae bacterium]
MSDLPSPIAAGLPLTALAPMQDVTDLAFMRVIAHYGAPDYFFTEFFRVHSQSRPEKHILRSIDENTTGRPVFAQLIGENLPDLARTVEELLRHPIAGIDLNLGCPAPKVYKKNVGGGLLRDPDKIDQILGCLRAAVPGLLTVKMRIGFDDTAHFDRVLDLINTHRVDLLSVHGRTVKEMYRSEVHYDFIARAVASVRCPVLANGNLTSVAKAASVLASTRAAGVMVGRHAIRNPWIFRQCREHFSGQPVLRVTLADVRDYIDRLYRATQLPEVPELAHVAKMKKYLNFVGQGVDPAGAFLHAMRRTETEANLFAVCDEHLLADPTREFSPEPYPGVIARPNCETPAAADGCSLETVTA